MNPTFSFIVITYQSAPHIEACLKAICAQDGDFEIILVDNGSDDADYAKIASAFGRVKYINNGANLGFAKGNNIAAAQAKGEWLCLINPDAFVAPDWLGAMRDAITAHPDLSIFTSLQVDAANPQKLDGVGDGMSLFGFPYRMGYGHARPNQMRDALVFSPCGAAMIIRRSLFEALGGFEDSFFCYCEDADLGFRAQLKGEQTLFVHSAVVHHVGSASLGLRSNFAIFHGYRNRIWLLWRNMPLLALFLTLPAHLVITAIFLLKDAFKGHGRVAWRGLVAGLAGLPKIAAFRKRRQKIQPEDALSTLRAMTFDPIRTFRRAIDHRPPH